MTYIISRFSYICGWRIRVKTWLSTAPFNGKIYDSAEQALVDLANITHGQPAKIIIREH